jgi:hypothetical protein
MVLFEIDDERIRRLAVNTLKRAFIGEFERIHQNLSGKSLESAADTLFAFYVQYIAHVHLEDKLDPRTPGRIFTHTHMEDEGPRPIRGEILLFLPASMRDKFTDNEIIGVIAHELGHLFSEFHYATSHGVGIGDMRPIEVEWTADEAARLLGFEKEMLAMRAKIPLPEERPPSSNISIHCTHGPSTGV